MSGSHIKDTSDSWDHAHPPSSPCIVPASTLYLHLYPSHSYHGHVPSPPSFTTANTSTTTATVNTHLPWTWRGYGATPLLNLTTATGAVAVLRYRPTASRPPASSASSTSAPPACCSYRFFFCTTESPRWMPPAGRHTVWVFTRLRRKVSSFQCRFLSSICVFCLFFLLLVVCCLSWIDSFAVCCLGLDGVGEAAFRRESRDRKGVFVLWYEYVLWIVGSCCAAYLRTHFCSWNMHLLHLQSKHYVVSNMWKVHSWVGLFSCQPWLRDLLYSSARLCYFIWVSYVNVTSFLINYRWASCCDE